MEPQIQYAKAADGVSIAFCTLGEGMPLVYMPFLPISHAQLEWQNPESRRWHERLAEKRKLIRYDGRGTGLSDREVTDYSLDAHLLDLEAVVDRLGLERFTLYGSCLLGPVAIAYAARHPERISHLVLWCTYARASDAYVSAQAQSFAALRDKDWELYTETLTHALLGWSAGEPARRYAALMRESITQEALQAAIGAAMQFDVTDLLPQAGMPTLVFHRREVPFPDLSMARGLASRMPNARLAVLEGRSLSPALADTDAVLGAIDEFLGEGEEESAGPLAAGDVHTILFTDMESSTALRQRLGDARTQELVRTHNTVVRDALKTHGGSEIKHTGDGIMASFPTASGALECAVSIQRGVAAHVEEHPDAPLGVYIGLNAGEPISEEKDLFGTSVDLARRICDRAEPGEILVSDVVRQLAAGKGFLFSDRGDVVLRGFEDPLRLYEVRWQEA